MQPCDVVTERQADMLAISYPLLGVFWTLLWLFCFIAWAWLLFEICTDIFRSRDLSGWGKAGWTVLVLVVPLVGALVYLIVRGDSMHQREAKEAAQAQKEMDDYIRRVASGGPSTASELAKLAELHDAGTINDKEFEEAKHKILAA
jgi:hypothetical protein